MERVQMCRMCLVEDAPMYVVVNRKMREVYEKLTNKQFVTEDRRPVFVCYFCCSRLKQCCRIQRQCLAAEELFAQLLDEDYEVHPSIKPALGLNNGFIKSPIELISIVGECQTECHAVKEEVPADCERLRDIIEPKEELQVDELEMDNPDFSDVEDIPVHRSESEYDVSVTVFKTEVEEEQNTNWSPVEKKPNLHIRRTKLEDVIKEEQENEQSDSKIMCTNSAKRIPQCTESVMYTKLLADNTINNSSSVIITSLDTNFCNTSDIGKDDLGCKMSNKGDGDGVNRYRRICVKEKPYKCEICQYSCDQKYHLTRHLRVHNGEKPYKCDVCHYSCNDKSNLNKHILKHTDEKPYKCDICQHVFSRKGPFNNHMRIHTGKKPYKCEVCQHAFNQKGDLIKHNRIHTNEKPYKCEICQYSCVQKYHLTRHLRVHTGEKPYKCDVCHYSCNDKSDLNKHILIHNDEKPYKCDICQHVFSRKGPFNNHMRIHTGKKPYKCEVCQHAFNQKGDLIRHIRIHTNEKPYKCEVCQYSCNQNSALTRHKRTHTNEKPYKCEVCQYSCKQKVHIIKHIRRKHTGKISFECDICQRSFYTKYLLHKHLQMHTGDKPYKCEVCQYSCYQKGLLKNHILKHHTGQNP